jgi:GNAT superfamily N-acetyltransferase
LCCGLERVESGLVRIMIEPATPDRWDDISGAFGSRAKNPDSCWCQRFRAHTEVSNRVALRAEIESASVPPGLIAYVDGAAAGWTRVVPRNTLPGVLNNRALRRVLDVDPLVWWVACFAIRRDQRGRGIGDSLLRAAADYARLHGASAIEGHPVDVSRLQTGRVSGSALFTGTHVMFESAGFREIGRTYPSRPIMRRDLTLRATHNE